MFEPAVARHQTSSNNPTCTLLSQDKEKSWCCLWMLMAWELQISSHSLDDTRLNKNSSSTASVTEMGSGSKAPSRFSKQEIQGIQWGPTPWLMSDMCQYTAESDPNLPLSLAIPKYENNTTVPWICYQNNCFEFEKLSCKTPTELQLVLISLQVLFYIRPLFFIHNLNQKSTSVLISFINLLS